jgi:hypothetical protein
VCSLCYQLGLPSNGVIVSLQQKTRNGACHVKCFFFIYVFMVYIVSVLCLQRDLILDVLRMMAVRLSHYIP